jgi:protein-tyrosine phosphatase
MEFVPSVTAPPVTTAPVTSAPVMARLHRVEGTYNLRDTGGYRTSDGATRWGKLLRSDALHQLTDTSRESLADLGIALVIDLRDESELLSAPSQLDGLGLTVVHAPIYPTRTVGGAISGAGEHSSAGGVQASPADGHASVLDGLGDVTLRGLYRTMLTDNGNNLARAVQLIARAGDAPVLVHCTAGKDRTGLVVALSLLAVGVSREDVVADYSVTEQNLAGEWVEVMLSRIVEFGVTATPAIRELMSASPPALIEEAIDLVIAQHGSVENYLLDHGLTHADLDLLRAALVDTGAAGSLTTNTPAASAASSPMEGSAS